MPKPAKQKVQLIEDAKDLGLSLLSPATSLLSPETVTNPKMALVAVGTAILQNKFTKFYSEYTNRKKKGLVRDDVSSEQDMVSEMLKFIQDGEPDSKIEAAKNFFFKSIEPGTSEAERMIIFEFIQICKKLSTNDLSVMKAAYHIAQGKYDESIFNGVDRTVRYRIVWFKVISRHNGHNIEYLVERSEQNLIEQKLITPIEERSPSTYMPEGKFRLTDLGYKFCEYLDSKDSSDETSPVASKSN